MSAVKCFLLKKTGTDALWLRRYGGSNCTASGGCHNAMIRIENAITNASDRKMDRYEKLVPRTDPRWPANCACGYTFTVDDHWQVFPLSIYLLPDGRETTVHRRPPPGMHVCPAGAMFFSDWCPGPKKHDGPYLWVVLPDGAVWCVDGPSSNPPGPGWTRTGEPPTVTARPSILTSGYHGWLTDGELRAC